MADTYINDSDYAFTNQLDNYKLGTSFHGGNDYEEGQAAFNNMPEAMAVGRLMAMRQQAHLTSMDSRKTIFNEERAVKEKQEFDQFSTEIQEFAQIEDPVARAEQMAQYRRERPNLALNEDVRKTFADMDASNKMVTAAATDAYQMRSTAYNNKQLDRKEAIDAKIGEAEDAEAITQFRFLETKNKSERDRFMAVQDGSSADRMSLYQSSIAQSSFEPEMTDEALRLGSIVGDSERWSGTLGSVAGLLNATNDAIHIEQSYGPFMSKFKPLEEKLKQNEIDPVALFSSDEAISKKEANRAMSVLGNDFGARRDFGTYYNTGREMRLAKDNRDKMHNYLLGEKDPETGKRPGGKLRELSDLALAGRQAGGDVDENKMIEFKILRDQMAGKVFPLAAGNKKILGSRAAYVAGKEEDMKLRKFDADLENIASLIGSRDANTSYTEARKTVLKNSADRRYADMLFRAMTKNGDIKVPKNDPAAAAKKFNDFYETIQAEAATQDFSSDTTQPDFLKNSSLD